MKLKLYFFETVIVVFFLITRLVNLGIIPIFTDEAIYSYWAQIALHDPVNRYVSLEDGKQPLFIWLAAISQYIIRDPLIASRFVSVFAGAVSLFGIYSLGKHLFNRRTALFASSLYVFLPFTFLYDRLALYDSLLTATVIYSVYFSIKLTQKPKLENALLAGIAIGLGLLTKSSALLFLYLLPAPLLIYLTKKDWRKKVVSWVPMAFLTFVIAQVIYNSLRLSPLFYMISRKNLEFIKPVAEVLKNPFEQAFSNATTLVSWFVQYVGFGLAAIFVVVSCYLLHKKDKLAALLLIYISFPFSVETFFNKVLYPRFMLFYFPFIILLLAHAFSVLKTSKKLNGIVFNLVMTLALLFPFGNTFLLLTNPIGAKIASSDYGQYINSWPAGYGVKEVVEILKTEAKTQPIYIGTEGTFGLLPFALKIYFYGQQNPQITGFWPVDANQLPQEILTSASTHKTFFLFNENQKPIENPRLKLVAKFQKGSSNSFMRLYEVK